MTADATAPLRRTVYFFVGVVAVGIGLGKLAGVENVYEPSRHAPPTATDYGAGRDFEITPRRQWPATRPEPSPMFSSNDRSRWATVRALVEHNTYVVGQRTVDPATKKYHDAGIIFERDYDSLDKVMDPATGKFYSSKPPLLPTIVAGGYWVLRNTVGWDFVTHRWHLVITLLTLVNVIPFAFALYCMATLLDHHYKGDFGRVYAYVVIALGTFMTPFLTTFSNHVIASCCVVFAVYALLRPRRTGGTAEALVAGLFAGFAASFELPALALGGAVFAAMVVARPRQALLGFLPGLSLPIVALLACNYIAIGTVLPAYSEFGGPWYDYEGSYWQRVSTTTDPRGMGVDFAKERKSLYAFHLLFGHHGFLSLTPALFLGLTGLLGVLATAKVDIVRAWKSRSQHATPFWTMRLVCVATCAISIVVIGFYIYKTNNYGGSTSAPRWLMWLTPLWVLAIPPAAERLGRTTPGRVFAGVLLAVSAFSVSYPASNPWRNPWIMQLGEQAGLYRY